MALEKVSFHVWLYHHVLPLRRSSIRCSDPGVPRVIFERYRSYGVWIRVFPQSHTWRVSCSLKHSFMSVERSERKYAKRYPHRFRYVEEPADPVHRPLDSYRYRRDVKDMCASGTDGSQIDKAVSILARGGDCLPASFDERYVFTDRRDMRYCAVGGGWRLIYCYSEKALIFVGLMEEDPSSDLQRYRDL